MKRHTSRVAGSVAAGGRPRPWPCPAAAAGFSNKPAQQQTGSASLQILIGLVRRRGDQGGAGRRRGLGRIDRQQGHRHPRPMTSPSSWARRSPAATRPTVFYVDAARFADYASVGALLPYGDKIPDADDFYSSLRKTFTYQGKLYCIPKDFSTIAMEINTDLWAKAGLGTADVPTTWDQLTTAAQKLKAAGVTPIAIGDTRDRIGAFMVEAGGGIVNADGTKATADSPQNLQALQYVQTLLKSGYAQYPKAAVRRLGR